MGSSPLDGSHPAPSVAPAAPGAGRLEAVPHWAYGLAAVVLVLPALIWAAGALVLSALVEW